MPETLPSNNTPDNYQDHSIDQRIQSWAVRRSNGDIEKGWMEEGRGTREGVEFARLFKSDGNGGSLHKDVPLEKLQQLREELYTEKTRDDILANVAIEASTESVSSDAKNRFDALLDPNFKGDIEAAAVRPVEDEAAKMNRVRTAADHKYQSVRNAGATHEEAEAAANRVWKNSGF